MVDSLHNSASGIFSAGSSSSSTNDIFTATKQYCEEFMEGEGCYTFTYGGAHGSYKHVIRNLGWSRDYGIIDKASVCYQGEE
jgi:hypothetical protein